VHYVVISTGLVSLRWIAPLPSSPHIVLAPSSLHSRLCRLVSALLLHLFVVSVFVSVAPCSVDERGCDRSMGLVGDVVWFCISIFWEYFAFWKLEFGIWTLDFCDRNCDSTAVLTSRASAIASPVEIQTLRTQNKHRSDALYKWPKLLTGFGFLGNLVP
jgi:hypothetical protein